MRWNVLAALGLALLATTAGCSAPLLGDGTSTRTEYEVPETTATTEEPTEPPTETTTPPTASPAFRSAVATHDSALRAAGEFELVKSNWEYRGARPDERPPNRTVAADLARGRYWSGGSGEPDAGASTAGSVYQNGTAVYNRVELDNGTIAYRLVPEDRERPPTPRMEAVGWLRSVPNRSVLIPFERNGTVTLDGEELVRFTATEPGPIGCLGGGGTPAYGTYPGELRNLTRFHATALVDDRGIVRRYECVMTGILYTGDRYTVRTAWSVTAVGTTTYRAPERTVNASGSTVP